MLTADETIIRFLMDLPTDESQAVLAGPLPALVTWLREEYQAAGMNETIESDTPIAAIRWSKRLTAEQRRKLLAAHEALCGDPDDLQSLFEQYQPW